VSEAEASDVKAGAAEGGRRRRGRLWHRVLAVLLPLVVVFAIGEVWVRYRYDIVDPRPYFLPGVYEEAEWPLRWRLQADYDGHYHQQTDRVPVHTNALGMRDPLATPERLGAERRVLLLGDSITFGRGVADEDTFARRLEARWRDALGDVAVFNAGVPGYDSLQELASLRRLGPEVEPHLVILTWYRNDVLVPSQEVEALVIDGYLAQSEEDYEHWRSRYIDHTGNPLDWSALIRLGRVEWKNFKLLAWKLEERAQEYEQMEQGATVASQEAIAEAAAWCRERGAELRVVLFPAREETEAESVEVEADHVAEMVAFCEEAGIGVVDLTGRWRAHWEAEGETLYLPRDRCHPNAAGHAQVAAWYDELFRDDLKALGGAD